MPLVLIACLALATAVSLRAWRRTRDGFYLTIALATLLFAASRLVSLYDPESVASLFLRLAAFLVLIGDIIGRRLVM